MDDLVISSSDADDELCVLEKVLKYSHHLSVLLKQSKYTYIQLVLLYMSMMVDANDGNPLKTVKTIMKESWA